MRTIKLTEEQLRKIEEISYKYDPSALFGGYIVKGDITIFPKRISDNEIQAMGVLRFLLAGDFDDEGEMKPRWFKSATMYGPIFQRYKDDDGYDCWEYAIQWCDNFDYEVLDMFVDIEWAESEA